MGDDSGPVIWIGTAEAAVLLGLSPRELYRLLNEARIPSYRVGRLIRLKRVDIDAFIGSCARSWHHQGPRGWPNVAGVY